MKIAAMFALPTAILYAAADDFPVIQGKSYKFEKVAEGVKLIRGVGWSWNGRRYLRAGSEFSC
jgi:hypothetical protein